MRKVKKIKIISFAKFQAYLFILLGFMYGMLYSVGGFIIDLLVTIEILSSVSMSTSGLGFGTVLAFGALLGICQLYLPLLDLFWEF